MSRAMHKPIRPRAVSRPVAALEWAQLLRVVHLLPGRVRLRFKALKGRPSTAAELQHHLGALKGISRVEVNPQTGSVLLHYDPLTLRSPAFLIALSQALGKVFPGQFAPGRLRLVVEQLAGNARFARKVAEHLSPIPGIEAVEVDPSTGACLLVYDPHTVTTPRFMDAISGPLQELLPGLDLRDLMARAGLR